MAAAEREWNKLNVSLLCQGYLRRHLTEISVDHIANIVSMYVANFDLHFIHNKLYSSVDFDKANNKFICNFNKQDGAMVHGAFSTIIFTPCISQLFKNSVSNIYYNNSNLSNKNKNKNDKNNNNDKNNENNINKNVLKFKLNLKTIKCFSGWYGNGGYSYELGLRAINRYNESTKELKKLDKILESMNKHFEKAINKNDSNYSLHSKGKTFYLSCSHIGKHYYCDFGKNLNRHYISDTMFNCKFKEKDFIDMLIDFNTNELSFVKNGHTMILSHASNDNANNNDEKESQNEPFLFENRKIYLNPEKYEYFIALSSIRCLCQIKGVCKGFEFEVGIER